MPLVWVLLRQVCSGPTLPPCSVAEVARLAYQQDVRAGVGEQQVARGATDEWAWNAATNPLPQTADVAVIGGGIVGTCAAYFLARQGVSVALFEKGRIAGEQSSRNWGWVRQQGRSAIELPLMMRSLRLWQEMARDLGEDVGFRQGGSL